MGDWNKESPDKPNQHKSPNRNSIHYHFSNFNQRNQEVQRNFSQLAQQSYQHDSRQTHSNENNQFTAFNPENRSDLNAQIGNWQHYQNSGSSQNYNRQNYNPGNYNQYHNSNQDYNPQNYDQRHYDNQDQYAYNAQKNSNAQTIDPAIQNIGNFRSFENKENTHRNYDHRNYETQRHSNHQFKQKSAQKTQNTQNSSYKSPSYKPSSKIRKNSTSGPEFITKITSKMSHEEKLSREIIEVSTKNNSREPPSTDSYFKIKQLDIKTSETANGEPKERQRWFLQVRTVKSSNLAEENEWRRQMENIQRVRDNSRWRQPPMAPRFQNKNPPNLHPVRVSFSVVEWINDRYKQAMKHQVVKLDIPKDEVGRKREGYNALLNYKLGFKGKAAQNSTFVKLEVGDTFQIESLNFFIGKNTGFWFTDLSFNDGRFESLNTDKVSYKHFSGYLGNVNGRNYPIIAPSPSVSQEASKNNSANSSKNVSKDSNSGITVDHIQKSRDVSKDFLDTSNETAFKALNKTVEKIRNGSGESGQSSSVPSELSQPKFHSSMRSEIENKLKKVEKLSIEKTDRNENAKNESAKNENVNKISKVVSQDSARIAVENKPKDNTISVTKSTKKLVKKYEIFDPARKLKLKYKVPLPTLKTNKVNAKRRRKLSQIPEEELPYFTELPKLSQIERNWTIKPNYNYPNYASDPYHDWFKPIKMEKLVQEFRHHVHESIYHENRFFGVVSEIKEDLKKLNPNANDSSSYYTQTQNIKNFKITPLEFQVDENCNYRENKHGNRNYRKPKYGDWNQSSTQTTDQGQITDFWTNNFLIMDEKHSFTCQMNEDEYLVENVWSRNFDTHKSFQSEYPEIFVGSFVEFCYGGNNRVYPSSVVPFFNVFANLEQFAKWFPKVDLERIGCNLIHRQTVLGNHIKNRCLDLKKIMPEIELEIKEEDDQYILDRKDPERFGEEDELLWRGKEYLIMLMTGGEDKHWDSKMEAAKIEKFTIQPEDEEKDQTNEKTSKPKIKFNQKPPKNPNYSKNVKNSKILSSKPDQKTYGFRPLINPALILKRYQELVERAQFTKAERETDYKNIEIALDTVKEGAKSIKEKRTENIVTKVQEAVKLTNAGIRLLDNEVQLLSERVISAANGLPKSLVDEVNVKQD